ncbi:enolase C-terminal domain-like protein [Komagataeibacter rhaeticus]
MEELENVNYARLLKHVQNSDPMELAEDLLSNGISGLIDTATGSNTKCVLELALLDLVCSIGQLNLTNLLIDHTPELYRLPIDRQSLPVTQVWDLSRNIDDFIRDEKPFHLVKMKSSGNLREDIENVTRMRSCLSPEINIIIDANMAWPPMEVCDRMARLNSAGADIFEEPTTPRHYELLRDCRRVTGAKIMIDESLCSLEDATAALAMSACDYFNVRVSKCGGLSNSLRLACLALQSGIGWQLGVQVAEVGPLIAAERKLAFTLGNALTVEAGQSDRFFAGANVVAPFPKIDRCSNTISMTSDIGLGLSVTPLMDRYRVSGQMFDSAGFI